MVSLIIIFFRPLPNLQPFSFYCRRYSNLSQSVNWRELLWTKDSQKMIFRWMFKSHSMRDLERIFKCYLRLAIFFSRAGIFLSLILGWITAPSQFENEQKLPKIVYIIPNFLVLHFGENLMKIILKIPKLQVHEKLHKIFYAIYHVFLWWAINKTALHS